VLEPAIHSVCAIHKLSLNPFDVAEPGAVGELVQHAGGNEIWDFSFMNGVIIGHFTISNGELSSMINKDCSFYSKSILIDPIAYMSAKGQQRR